jgi:hypothetical protein
MSAAALQWLLYVVAKPPQSQELQLSSSQLICLCRLQQCQSMKAGFHGHARQCADCHSLLLQHVPGRVEHIEYFFDLGPREVHPWHKPAMPSQEKLQQSISSPVIVTPNPMVKEQVSL